MKRLHAELADKQREARVRVIKPPHALGFLDPDLPKRKKVGDGGESYGVGSALADVRGEDVR